MELIKEAKDNSGARHIYAGIVQQRMEIIIPIPALS